MSEELEGLFKQMAKFAAVGIAAFAVDAGCLVLLHNVFGVPTVEASIISFIVSTVFNYVESMRHVFTHREDMRRRHEFAIFVVLSLIGLAINTIVMWEARILFDSLGVDYEHTYWYLAVKVLATAIVSIWNFVSRRHWLDDHGQLDDNGAGNNEKAENANAISSDSPAEDGGASNE